MLARYKVQYVFGLHLWPALEQGAVFSRVNELMSRASEVSVDIYGKSTHIGNAAAGIDATAAAAEFYRLAREAEADFPEDVFRLLNFGKFQSGTARNALSAYARLEGSLRAFQDDVFDKLQRSLWDAVTAVESKFGCRVELTIGDSYPAVLNDAALLERVQRLAPVKMLENPSMTAEDFSWYQRFAGGIFFFLGLGDAPALHATNFDFDESVLEKGADFFEKLAEDFR